MSLEPGLVFQNLVYERPKPKFSCWSSNSADPTTGQELSPFLLNGLSGVAYVGQMIAVMGPSGCGKTTFLNVLANRINRELYQGEVKVQTGSHVSYVMQDDALMGSLTVRENLMYSAMLRLPSAMPTSEKEHIVDETIRQLGLEHCRDSYVGTVFLRGVSGGERRRVAVGMELVNNPRVLLLDEPTSGLDSTASYHVMSLIQSIARAGRTVLSTIHQPSDKVFGLFDSVMFLVNGSVAYFGPVSDLASFMLTLGQDVPEHSSLSELLMDNINDQFTSNLEEDVIQVQRLADVESPPAVEMQKQKKSTVVTAAFASSVHAQRLQERITAANAVITEGSYVPHTKATERSSDLPGFFGLTWTLVRRTMLNNLRNVACYWLRLGMYTMLALMMGTVWLQLSPHDQTRIQDRIGVHFFSVAFMCFMSVAAIPAFIEDRLIFQREQASGTYSAAVYLVSNFIITSPFVFLLAVFFTTPMYFLVSLSISASQFFRFLFFLYLALMVAESMMVLISAVTPQFIMALALGAGMNGFFMIVQGYFIRRDKIPNWWIWGHYMSYQKYSFEALLYNDFYGDAATYFNCALSSGSWYCLFQPTSGVCAATATTCTFSGYDVLREYGYQSIDLWGWMGVLIAEVFLYRFFCWLVLEFWRS